MSSVRIGVVGIRIDLHVHTMRYSACAPTLQPDHVVEAIREGTLDAVVITEHDRLWSPAELEHLNARVGERRIFSGVELSTPNAHIVAIGLRKLPPPSVIQDIEALGAFAASQRATLVLAHPFGYHGRLPAHDQARKVLHAVECAGGLTKGTDCLRARKLAAELRLPCVAASDSHYPETLGSAYTVFPRLPADEQELGEFIRSGKVTPIVGGEP